MALSRGRGGQRFSSTIWPGFVDAMTALLMVLMFVLTIFMVVQSVLRDQVDRQESQLNRLADQIAGLTSTLALTRDQRDSVQGALAQAQSQLADTTDQLTRAQGDITTFEAQVARLAAARDAETSRADSAEGALVDARTRITALGETESELRDRLRKSEAEVTAMTLSLEESRKKAEETLTLLAAAEAARRDLQGNLETTSTEAERKAALLAVARDKLAAQEQASTEAQRRVALLNAQVAELNGQLASIQQALNVTSRHNAQAEIRLEELGAKLNAALLQAATEQKKRLALEEEARARLEEEAADLARYRSDFFGQMRELLEGREGVRVVGDRFVFQSEVLFGQGEATLAPEGRAGVRNVTEMLAEISDTIPEGIDWVIRVDGHTDSTPLSGQGRYRDNWELSQARALAVVRYMVDDLGFPADRVAPTGFADTRPIAPDDTPENRARNRRIELKLTER